MGEPAGRQQEGILLVGLLGRRLVFGALDDGPSLRVLGGVLLRRDRRAGREVVTVRLAVVAGGVEDAVLVLPLATARVLGVAGPLDRPAAQHPVAHAG